MSVVDIHAAKLKHLSARHKALLADHLWREAESKLGPTDTQIAELDRRAAAALKHPRKLRPYGDALLRLRR